MGFTLTPIHYISWVQRSLNRILGSSLLSNGKVSTEYRALIKEFQFAYALTQTGDIDVADQNELIKANHRTPEYIGWIQDVLMQVGAGLGLTISGMFDKQTKESLLSFQSYMGLIDDGWIGAKTETALILESGIRPPGTVKHGPVKPSKPKRKPKRVRPADPLSIAKRTDRVIGAVLAEAVSNPSVYPNGLQRKRLKCLLHLLKPHVPSDNKYIPSQRARSFVLGTEWSFTKGNTPDSISNNAREILEGRVSKMPVADRTDQEKIRTLVLHLYYEIERGLNEIAGLYGVHGDSNLGAKMLHQWAYNKQNRRGTVSILACFK